MSFPRKQNTRQTVFFAFGMTRQMKRPYASFFLLTVGKFNWKGTIKAVLKQAPDNEISVKKLKKKVYPATKSGMEQLRRDDLYVCVV